MKKQQSLLRNCVIFFVSFFRRMTAIAFGLDKTTLQQHSTKEYITSSTVKYCKLWQCHFFDSVAMFIRRKQCNTKICCNHYLSIQREKLLLFILSYYVVMMLFSNFWLWPHTLQSLIYAPLACQWKIGGLFICYFFFLLPLSDTISSLQLIKLNLSKGFSSLFHKVNVFQIFFLNFKLS